MKLYEELADAIIETVNSTEETDEFKLRLGKLIENYFENTYTESDIDSVIELIQHVEE
jgi:hypothetical protein